MPASTATSTWFSMTDSTRVHVGGDLARRQAAAVIEVLDARYPGAFEALAEDAVRVVSSFDDVEVRFVSDGETNVGCSVAGAYVAGPPARIAVAKSASLGRRAFTALHELGHHLQQTDVGLADALSEQPDRGAALEDAACDSFAGMVLLPSDVVAGHIGTNGPTAHNIVSLWCDSTASRAAACVRAAETLPAPGHVLLLDETGTVTFRTSNLLPPVARGSDQSHIDLVTRTLTTGQAARGTVRLGYRDGITGQELHAQTASLDGYVVLVAVTDHAPWEDFILPTADTGPRGRWWTCSNPACGHEFRTFDPNCARCNAPTCPRCNQCECVAKVAERRCAKCLTVYPLSYFNGASPRCRDCD